jgi:hypothetical protein
MTTRDHRQHLAETVEDRFDVTVAMGGDRLELCVPEGTKLPPIVDELDLEDDHDIEVLDYLSTREIDGRTYDAYQLKVACESPRTCRFADEG